MIKEQNRKMLPVLGVINSTLARLGSAEQTLLVHLWQNWSVVMGPELEGLVYPLGHKKSTLNVAGDDSVSLQEISMQSSEILERVNAFMEKDFFTHLNVCLLFGKNPLNMLNISDNNDLRPKAKIVSISTGKYLDSMDASSAVARCYARYANLRG